MLPIQANAVEDKFIELAVSFDKQKEQLSLLNRSLFRRQDQLATQDKNFKAVFFLNSIISKVSELRVASGVLSRALLIATLIPLADREIARNGLLDICDMLWLQEQSTKAAEANAALWKQGVLAEHPQLTLDVQQAITVYVNVSAEAFRLCRNI